MFLSAGEASGDHYGAEIAAELRGRIAGARFFGLGGSAMEAAGQRRIVRAEDVAHMGITEVIRHAPYIFGQYRNLVGALKREKPDVAVLIDFPDVNFRLAKHCKRLGIPVLWFVSPQLWAWKRRRLRWVQQRVSKMLVIFPFEEEFYRNRGVDASFVGHPLAALPFPAGLREEYAAQYGLDPDKPWIALLPGSRSGEIFANLSGMVDAAVLLGDRFEYLIPVAATVSAGTSTAMRKAVDDLLAPRPDGTVQEQTKSRSLRDDKRKDNAEENAVPYHAVANPMAANPPRITFVRDAREALCHCRAAIVASGTATVQALTIGNPFVVVYRVSPLTFAIAKRLVRYPPEIGAPGTLEDEDGNLPIAMPNLIAGRRIVPELLNERFTAQNLAAALRPLLEDSPARAQMLTDLAETCSKLLPPAVDGQAANPIAAVCDAIESLLGRV